VSSQGPVATLAPRQGEAGELLLPSNDAAENRSPAAANGR